METHKNCQSCGMPMRKDPMGGGTNVDDSKSAEYCSYCYVGGAFMRPDIDTPEKMQAFVKEKLKKIRYPNFIAGFFTKSIPRLKRWRKA